jgi:hypothetical protein
MSMTDTLPRLSEEQKAALLERDKKAEAERKKVLAEKLARQRSQNAQRFWNAMTPEQRVAHNQKVSEGKRNKGLPKTPGPGWRKGERHYLSKLTEAQVREIYASPDVAEVVAEKYGIDVSSVRCIWRRETWKHLDLPHVERKDRRRSDKPRPPKAPPRISKELREEVLACPYEDTRELAKRLGMHWFDVATIRLKANGGYNRLKDERPWK